MKQLPIGGKLVAPELVVRDEIFAVPKKFCIALLLFSSLHFIFHRCNRFPPLFGNLIELYFVFSNF